MSGLLLTDKGCFRYIVLMRRVFIHWKNGGVFPKLKQIHSKREFQVPFKFDHLEKPEMSTNFN